MSWKTCKLLFTLTSIAWLSHCVQFLKECYLCGDRKLSSQGRREGNLISQDGHWATWMALAFNHECFTEVMHNGQLFVFQKRWRFWKHKQLEAQKSPHLMHSFSGSPSTEIKSIVQADSSSMSAKQDRNEAHFWTVFFSAVTEAENLGIGQYHVLPYAFHVIFYGKSSLSNGNDCEICSDTAASLLETGTLELKRNCTERSRKWVVSPGQSTVPGQLCVSGLPLYLDSPGFALCHYISGKTMVKTDS